MYPRRAREPDRGPARPPCRPACRATARSSSTAGTSSATSTRCSTGWRGSRSACVGRVARPHRQADPRGRQHRDRRLGPRAGDGVPGAARLQRPRPRLRFVSNVDATDLVEALRDLDPAETLVIVSSKTFTTVETMTNARGARQWLLDGLGGDEAAIAKHVVAVSTNLEAVAEFGIDPANAFGFWDWVGGRYSMDSAIGLSTMIAIGPERSTTCSRASMRSTCTSPRRRSSENLPAADGRPRRLVPGLLRRRDARRPAVRAVPRALPAYLQQLVMESNGKRVTLDGDAVAVDTAPVVWGEPGTNGQHSFHQLLHQGTALVPVRHHRLRVVARTPRRAPRPPARQRAGAGAGARVRADRGRAARGRRPRGARPAQGDAREPPDDLPAARPADAVRARLARRPLRARRLHAGRRSGGSTRSTSGASSSGRSSPSASRPRSPASGPTRARPLDRRARRASWGAFAPEADVLELHEPRRRARARSRRGFASEGSSQPGGEALVADLYLGYGLSQTIRRTTGAPPPPEPCPLPLAACAVRPVVHPGVRNDNGDGDLEIGSWRRTWDEADHAGAVAAVRAAIARGDVYQVNLVQHLSASVRRVPAARSPPGSAP